jgi:hypothetical protein
MQNFTLISKLLRKMLKICEQKVTGKKKGAKLGIFLFYTTNLQKFLANNFFWVPFFFNYVQGFEISVKFCVFWILISKKRIKKILGSLCTVRI